MIQNTKLVWDDETTAETIEGTVYTTERPKHWRLEWGGDSRGWAYHRDDGIGIDLNYRKGHVTLSQKGVKIPRNAYLVILADNHVSGGRVWIKPHLNGTPQLNDDGEPHRHFIPADRDWETRITR